MEMSSNSIDHSVAVEPHLLQINAKGFDDGKKDGIKPILVLRFDGVTDAKTIVATVNEIKKQIPSVCVAAIPSDCMLSSMGKNELERIDAYIKNLISTFDSGDQNISFRDIFEVLERSHA